VSAYTGLLEASGKHRHRSLESCELCAQRIQQAASLYRGDFLADFSLPRSAEFEQWALLKREELQQQLIDALDRLVTYFERRGQYQQAIRCARRTAPSFSSLIRPGFENELCITLGVPLAGPGVTLEQARSAISHVAPALEIIEKRHVARPDMALALADNGQQKAFVTGAEVPLGGLDLAEVMVDVTVNGVAQERARGAEVLGTGPIASIAWLANKLAQFDRHLVAGTRVMAGSFTKQYDVNPGDAVEARFERVGVVTTAFR
jgi:hypothetical protein